MTKPSTQADALLARDPAIAKITWFDRNSRGNTNGRHDGPLGFARLVADLRAARADTAILLHHAPALAAALRLAGILRRHAYGFSRAQRLWLNAQPFLPAPPPFTEAAVQAATFATALGFPLLPEPSIHPDPAALVRVQTRLAEAPRPWWVFGIGANDADRQWGADNFSSLARHLAGTTILLGGPMDADLACAIAGKLVEQPRQAIGWPLADVAALLSLAEHFIGNDSGPLNLRAAMGRPAHALFGASGPLLHSRHIVPIVPKGGPRSGMAAIGVEQVRRDVLLPPAGY